MFPLICGKYNINISTDKFKCGVAVVQWFPGFQCQTKPMNQPLGGTAKRICLTDELKGTAVNLVDGRVCQLNIFVNKAVSYSS